MVIRRIREHVMHHNWFAVAIDLAIVIAGVFLGTQVSNWNQQRLSRDQANEDRAMLIDDLEANQQNLATRRHYYDWVHDAALKTLAALDRPASTLGDQFLIDAYQASQILPWSLKRNTYDEIQSTGRVAALGSPALRSKITNYYVTSQVTGENLETTMPYHDILRRFMPYAAQRAIRAACNEKITEDPRGQAVMVLPTGCTLQIDPAVARSAIDEVRTAPGLALDLNRLLVDLDQKILSTAVITRRAVTLEATLKQESH